MSGMCANFTEWLDGMQAAQEALPLTEPPAFLSSTVTSKLEPIEKEVRRLIKKPKPKEKKVKANATNATNTTGAANETDSTFNADGETSTKSEEPPATEGETKPDDIKEEL